MTALKAVKNEDEVVRAVEFWLKDVKEGRVKVRTAILVWRDGEGETIARMDCGVVSGASQLMGMLSFASQMVYESAKKS